MASCSATRFSPAEDEQLIELVSGHPVLWNMADKEFKNTLKKELLWTEIGQMVNISGNFYTNINFYKFYNSNYCVVSNK